MGNDSVNNKTINNNTQITFTLKSFLATIGSILAIFFVFYQLVILPRIETTESHYRGMFQDQKEQNRIFYEELNKLTSSVGAVNTSVTSLSERFKDLNQNLNSYSNSGGSFGDNVSNDNNQSNNNTRELTDNN